MKKILMVGGLIGALAMLTGCGAKVEVPPAHVGKIMGKDGYQENLIPTSKLRLAPCWAYCDRLVVLDVSDKSYTEPLTIFIPEDKLNLTVNIKTTLSVAPKKTAELFNSLSPVEQSSSLSMIESNKIYQTYAAQIIQTETREYLSQFSISEIASSNEKINADLRDRISKVVEQRTPFSVRYVGITDIKYPKIISDAQEAAAERREAIQQEEAQLQISKVKLERELQEARLNRAIEKEKAETEAMAQKTLAESVDARVLQLRALEVQRIQAEKWNGVLPTTIMGDAVPMFNVSK
jgi:regulator of protease activity HflC (stomatin/prohibitin superfamily)